MEIVPCFDAQHLTSIAKIMGDTNDGLTGQEIEYLLRDCRIYDPDPGMTKWKRLFNAFVATQNAKKVGNHVVMFINRAMNPVQYGSRPVVFRARQDRLNVVLAFSGMRLGDEGKVTRSQKTGTLDQALERAGRLHLALTQREVHRDVLAYCRAELLQENYFHAVLEATKSIAAKIRSLSGLGGDGGGLVQAAFGLGQGNPVLAINSLANDTDKGEQRGFINLLVGLFGTIRNPLAHNAKVEWAMSEQDALDILTLASLVHRKLDSAYRP